MRPSSGKMLLFGFVTLLVLSIVLGILSFYPSAGVGKSSRVIIDDSFNLTANETFRQGIGSFYGDENISLDISSSDATFPLNFTLLTYNGPQYNITFTGEINYTFPAGADYYEAVFTTNSSSNLMRLQVNVLSPTVTYPFSWLALPAKTLFLFSWAALIVLILKPEIKKFSQSSSEEAPTVLPVLGLRGCRKLQALVILSLVFWIGLLAVNTYPLGTFENWYTDSARNSYSANLFTKVGFSIFNTPLGQLSSSDFSFYKFVTWPEMPHLYPIGSIFLYLPFGALLESGVTQSLVLKLEITLFLVVSHLCLYWFLKRFLNQELHSILKALGIYIFYIVLIIYAANGQFESVALLFSMLALAMFLDKRYDIFLLFIAISATIKYQAAIFLVPLIIVGLLRLFHNSSLAAILKNKAILVATGLVGLDLFTAYLSLPFLMEVRPELVMNVANAFSPHAQSSWALQVFAVFLVLSATLSLTVYLLNKNRLISLFALFSLLPCFTLPYFQQWYMPFFFVYLLIPQRKNSLQLVVIWLLLIAFVLSFGGLSYNPVVILDRIRQVLNL